MRECNDYEDCSNWGNRNGRSSSFEEATKRGHAVTAIVRDADKAREKLGSDATILVGDLFEMHADVFEEFDVVVNAFANHKDAYLNLDALTHLLHEFRRCKRVSSSF